MHAEIARVVVIKSSRFHCSKLDRSQNKSSLCHSTYYDHRHKVTVEKPPDHVVKSLMLSSDKGKIESSTSKMSLLIKKKTKLLRAAAGFR